jgi:hypothetical protein
LDDALSGFMLVEKKQPHPPQIFPAGLHLSGVAFATAGRLAAGRAGKEMTRSLILALSMLAGCRILATSARPQGVCGRSL